MPYKDPSRRRAYGRAWMRRNPDKAREAMRRWRERHPEADRAARRRHYVANAESVKSAVIAYRRANPDVVQTVRRLRRARATQAEGSYTVAEWRSLVTRHGGACAYCDRRGPLTADHRVPLARGGTNYIANILPACRSCNARKRLLTESEFRARLARERGTAREP